MWTQNENVDTKKCRLTNLWTQKWLKNAIFELKISEPRNLYFYIAMKDIYLIR